MHNASAATEPRLRSPHFPSAGLKQALSAVQMLYERDRTAPIHREVAAEHLGYSSLNGAARRLLGTLSQYSLINDLGEGKIRVSEFAQAIIHPRDSSERFTLINETLQKPRIFAELISKYGLLTLPSDATLTAQLIRDYKFTPEAAKDCIKSLKQGVTFIRSVDVEQHQDETHSTSSSASMEDVGNPLASHSAQAINPHVETGATERLAVRLSGHARAELSLFGSIGLEELTKFKRWLTKVVEPWVEFMAEEQVETDDNEREHKA